MLAPQAMIDATDVARVLSEQLQNTTMPVLSSWLGGIDVEKGREIFNQAGIATFDTPERAVRAFMNLHRHARGIEMLQQIPPRLSTRIQVDRENAGRLVEKGLASANGLLTETEAKSLLAAYGIPVNPTAAAASADEALSLAKGYGFPVVMKILSRDITHKTDAGDVVLNLKDAEFAVLVGDPWHGKGIGAHLLATCLDIARERRFGTIWGCVLAENKGMLALGRKLGFTIKRADQSGEFELTLDMSRLPTIN